MPVFIDVEYLEQWRLFVVLSDGTSGMLDLARGAAPPLFAQLFARLKSERYCARVFINRHHQLAWPTGCTLSAHEIYHLLQPIDEQRVFRAKPV